MREEERRALKILQSSFRRHDITIQESNVLKRDRQYDVIDRDKTIKCDDQKVIQTTREFVKFDGEVDVSKIPQTTDDYVKECSRIDPEQLQHLIRLRVLNEKQEEWLRLCERLDHMPYAQMKTLCGIGILPKSLLKQHALPI